MAGHSKWANTKHRKARIDAKRGKIFSNLAKEIMVVARQGGGDPSANITLRTLIQKAKTYNMPGDNIDRAIKKGTGELAADALEEVTYEGFATGGVAVLVHCLTDNRNRSVSEVRNAFTKAGNTLGGAGTVSHLFQRKGQILISTDEVDEEKLMEIVLDAGGEDIAHDGDEFQVITGAADFMAVVDALEAASIPLESSELTFIPDMEVAIDDPQQVQSMIRFIDALEELDDVQNVYANFSVDDAILEAVAG